MTFYQRAKKAVLKGEFSSFSYNSEEYTYLQTLQEITSEKLIILCENSQHEKVVFKVIRILDDDLSDLYEFDGETDHHMIEKYKQLHQSNVLSLKLNYSDDANDDENCEKEFIIISDYKGKSLDEIRKEQLVEMEHHVTILQILLILTQCLGALQSLHVNNLVHRDIKLKNIFMMDNMVVLGDLGCVKFMEDNQFKVNLAEQVDDLLNEMSTLSHGTKGYIAPEIFNEEMVCLKSDIWSLGVTILNYLFYKNGKLQVTSESSPKNVENIVDQLFSENSSYLETDNESWEVIKTLCKRMVSTDIEQRYSASDSLQYLFPNSESSGFFSLGLNYKHMREPLKRNKNLVEYICSINGLLLEHVGEELKSDKQVVMKAVHNNGMSLQYSHLRNDREIVLEAAKINGHSFEFASDELRSDRDFIINLLESVSPNIYRYVHNSLKSDREIIRHAIKFEQNSHFLPYPLENDRYFIRELIDINPNVLKFTKFKNDKEIVMAALEKDRYLFEYVSDDLKVDVQVSKYAPLSIESKPSIVKSNPIVRDKELILQMVSRDGWSLENADEDLRNDRYVVLESVKQTGFALEFASKELQNDREIVLEAVRREPFSIRHASEELRSDPEIVRIAVQFNGMLIKHASDALKKDIEFMKEMIEIDGDCLQYADESLKNDKELVLKGVSSCGSSLDYVSAELKSDKQVVKQAVSSTQWAFVYASPDLKSDKNFLLELLESTPGAEVYKYFPNEIKLDKEFSLKCFLLKPWSVMYYIPDELKQDREFILEIAKKGYLEHLPDWKDDREIVSESVKCNRNSISFASEELKKDREFVLQYYFSPDIRGNEL